MSSPTKIIIHSSEKIVDEILLVDGESLSIKALENVTYEIKDLATETAPEEFVVKRNGDHLELFLGSETGTPHVILEGYYLLENPSPLVGMAEDGQFYSYVPQSGQAASLAWNMEDGESSYQSLGYDTVGSAVPWWPILLGGLLLLGAGAALAGSSSSSGGGAIEKDTTSPNAPDDVLVSNDGTTVTGTGEEGTTVIIKDPDGNTIGTGTVDDDGDFEVDIQPPQTNGEDLVVTLEDDAGNTSPDTVATAPDITAPDAAGNLDVSDDGTSVTGTGEPGAEVTIKDPNGVEIGSGVVDGNGDFEVVISPAQTNGEELVVTLKDDAGNTSTPSNVVADDTTAPDAPTGVATDGTVVTGQGEPGATVKVEGPSGQNLGSAVVDNNGDFTVTLNPAQANGEGLTVNQEDAAGNASPDVTVSAPDTTAPDAPTDLVVSNNGGTVTGKGEIGTTASVIAPNGVTLGTAVVDGNGNFDVTLTPAQTNGEKLSVRLTDDSSNTSLPAGIDAPDTTNPNALTNVATDGIVVTGQGEPGATVTVKGPAGQNLGSGIVDNNGDFTVTLAPSQANGEELTVNQKDAADNTSPDAIVTAPDTTSPDAPTGVATDGIEVTGQGEPGATVTVKGPAGQNLGSAIVDNNGDFTVILTTPQSNGEDLTVNQADAAGNVSPDANATAPDTTNPNALTGVATDGIVVTGQGESGATVTVKGPAGQNLGSGIVDNNGDFTVTLTPSQANGEELTVNQKDAADNTSPDAIVTAPDTTNPDAPTGVATDGIEVTGQGEPGATVTVKGPTGQNLGSAIVDNNGDFTVILTTPQSNGEALTVNQADAAGNISPDANATAPDTTAPDAPVDLVVSNNGEILTGKGEAGTTVTVKGPVGQILGSAIVDGNGDFSVTLNPIPTNGEALSVTLTDAALNTSLPSTTNGLNTSAPDAPENLVVSGDGLTLTGTGEIGTTATVVAPDGTTVLGTAVVVDDGNGNGIFSVTLTPAQTNNEELKVTLTDTGSNTSLPGKVNAPDSTNPDAPENLEVSEDGSTLIGTGEAGTTAIVKAPNGSTIGTALVDENGNFSVTLIPAQIDEELLSVTLTDNSNNVSASETTNAPDGTPPDAPTNLIVSGDGTTVTGKGEAGTTVTVKDSSGNDIGPDIGIIVDANGDFTVPLDPAQNNGQTVTVTLTDDSNNESLPTAATSLEIPTTPDGSSIEIEFGEVDVNGDDIFMSIISGTSADPGSIVTIKDAAGNTVGDTGVVVDAAGNYTVPLNDVYVDGEEFSVTFTNAAGTSGPATVYAPVIDPIVAANNSEQLVVDVIPNVITNTPESKVVFSLVNAGTGGIATADVVDIPDLNSMSISVAEGTEREITLKASGGGVTLANTFDLIIYKYNAELDNWQVEEDKTVEDWFTIILLYGESQETSFILPEGEYRLALYNDGVAVASGITLETVVNNTLDYNDPQGAEGDITGNVIDDIDVNSGDDQATSTTTVKSVTFDGVETLLLTNGQLTTIEGKYGTLEINSQGDYVYTIDSAKFANNPDYGQTDDFSYTIIDSANPEKGESTANLSIEISREATDVEVISETVALTFDEPVPQNITSEGRIDSITNVGIVGVGLGPIADVNAIPDQNKSMSIVVDEGTVREVTLHATGAGLGVLNIVYYDLLVYRKDDAGNYVLVHQEEDWYQYYAPLLLGIGVSDEITLTLPEGEYIAFLQGDNLGIDVGSGTTMEVTNDVLTDYSNLALNSGSSTGTLDLGEPDSDPGTTSEVLSINGFKLSDLTVNGDGNYEIDGVYGTLTVNAQTGEYSYTTNTGLTSSNFGDLDSFSYIYETEEGERAAGRLNLKLDGAGVVDDVIDYSIQMEQRSEVNDDSFNGSDSAAQNETLTFTLSSDNSNSVDIDLSAQVSTFFFNTPDTTLTYVLTKDGDPAFQQTETITGSDVSLVKHFDNLEAGNYTLQVSTTGTGGVQTVTLDAAVVATDIYADEYVVASLPEESGNLFTNDVNGDSWTEIVINNEHMYVQGDLGNDDNSVEIVGEFGTLTLDKDGNYTYVASGVDVGTEVFDYTLTSAFGTTSTGQLTVNVGHDAPVDNVTYPWTDEAAVAPAFTATSLSFQSFDESASEEDGSDDSEIPSFDSLVDTSDGLTYGGAPIAGSSVPTEPTVDSSSPLMTPENYLEEDAASNSSLV